MTPTLPLSLKKTANSNRLESIRAKNAPETKADGARGAEPTRKKGNASRNGRKRTWKDDIKPAREYLKTFPAIQQCLPLRIGAGKVLLKQCGPLIKRAVRKAIREHVNQLEYLEKLAAGGSRYTLDGKPDGEISSEHQRRAANILAHQVSYINRK